MFFTEFDDSGRDDDGNVADGSETAGGREAHDKSNDTKHRREFVKKVCNAMPANKSYFSLHNCFKSLFSTLHLSLQCRNRLISVYVHVGAEFYSNRLVL